jgi:pimeloyl-ACP methyl ester carboxylesterase
VPEIFTEYGQGPIAVPKAALPKTLRVQTHVNGELRQDSTSDDLIFSIPELISVLSAGQTLQPGDVLATGTPAGVGIGKKPPVFLEPGDEISISVTGLGTLTNKITQPGAINTTLSRVSAASAFELTNASRTACTSAGLTSVNGKPLFYQKLGSSTSSSEHAVFVHGLGGTKDYWTPLISSLSLADSATLHTYDFEGHGLSLTHPLSQLSISSLAVDLAGIFQIAGISASTPATLFAHSIGCLVAVRFALENPSLVKKLVLTGPPPSPLPEVHSNSLVSRAARARTEGMAAVVDAVVDAEVSDYSKKNNPLAIAAARLSLLGQDPEAYAKACEALARGTTPLEGERLDVDTLIITGREDKVSPPAVCEEYKTRIGSSRLVVLENVGHWHVFENVTGVAKAVRGS